MDRELTIYTVCMDVQSVAHTLRIHLQRKVNKNLSDYHIRIRHGEPIGMLQTLSSACFMFNKIVGLVHVKLELYTDRQYINIIDIITPTGTDVTPIETNICTIMPTLTTNPISIGRDAIIEKNKHNKYNNGQQPLWYVIYRIHIKHAVFL